MAEKKVIDYTALPTLEQFHCSDAEVRMIMGPIGSGKSVGCCIEVYARATKQKPSKDGIRRSRWAIVRNCYDKETELLTENGWKLFKDLLPGERVSQLNDSGQMEFVEPTYYYKKHYSGEMMGFKSEGVNFLVTPDHHMMVSKKRTRKQIWGEYEFKKAHEVYGKSSYRVKRDADWIGTHPGYSVDFFKWLGFWYAEGSCGVYKCNDGYTRHQCVITQDPSRYDSEELFRNANLPYTVADRPDGNCKTYRLSVTDKTKPLIKMLSTLGKSYSKYAPDWLKNAPQEHLEAFIDGFHMGDGHSSGSTRFLSTSSKQLADDFQEIGLRAGMVMNVALKTKAGIKSKTGFNNNYDHYLVTILSEKKHHPRLNVIKSHCKQDYGWYKEQYDDMVYCIEVPTHKIYVRRNGKAMWCSQTYGELKTTTIKTWQEWFPDTLCPIVYDSPIRGRIRMVLPDKTTMDLEIMFLALDKPKDAKRLLSLELTGIWFNEVREIPKTLVDAGLSRTGRYPSMADCPDDTSWTGMIADTNPPDDDSWYYKLAEKSKLPNWEFFRQPGGLLPVLDTRGRTVGYEANPIAENVQNHKQGYRYWMKNVGSADSDWIKVHCMGDYGAIFDGKPVYGDAFNEFVHKSPVPLGLFGGIPIMLAWDYGLTPACLFGQVTPTGQLRILRELWCEDGGLKQFTENAVKPMLANTFPGIPFSSVGDPAGEQRSQADELTCARVLANLKIPTMAASTNDFLPRRQAVLDRLTRLDAVGQPAILIDPSCHMILKGLKGGYKFERVQVSGQDEKFKDVASKNKFSHLADALQYMCLGVDTAAAHKARPLPPPVVPDTQGGFGGFV